MAATPIQKRRFQMTLMTSLRRAPTRPMSCEPTTAPMVPAVPSAVMRLKSLSVAPIEAAKNVRIALAVTAIISV